jgi:hypothetical protein
MARSSLTVLLNIRLDKNVVKEAQVSGFGKHVAFAPLRTISYCAKACEEKTV